MNRALDGVAEGQEAANTGTAAARVNQCRTAALAALAADWHNQPALSHDPNHNHNHSLCPPESHSACQGDDSVATHTYCPHCTLAAENYEMLKIMKCGTWAPSVKPAGAVLQAVSKSHSHQPCLLWRFPTLGGGETLGDAETIGGGETLRLPHQLGAAGLWAVTVVPQHSVRKITCRLLRRA